MILETETMSAVASLVVLLPVMYILVGSKIDRDSRFKLISGYGSTKDLSHDCSVVRHSTSLTSSILHAAGKSGCLGRQKVGDHKKEVELC